MQRPNARSLLFRSTRVPFFGCTFALLCFLALFCSLPASSALNIPSFVCPSDASSLPVCNSSSSDASCSSACQCVTCADSSTSRCYKSSLFQGSVPRDLSGSFLIFAVSVFSSVAGIGGGAMMTPILISVFGFNLAAAKMLSHICVFGNVCAQVTSPHPMNTSARASHHHCSGCCQLLPVIAPQPQHYNRRFHCRRRDTYFPPWPHVWPRHIPHAERLAGGGVALCRADTGR